MHYLKGAFVGPTDSMIVAPAAVRSYPHEEQHPTTEATMTNTNGTPGDSLPYGLGVDSNTIMIGTSSAAPETVQVTT
jgi:hypothetical protein